VSVPRRAILPVELDTNLVLTCTIEVAFTPSAAGPFSFETEFAYTPSAGNPAFATLEVTGSGIAVPGPSPASKRGRASARYLRR